MINSSYPHISYIIFFIQNKKAPAYQIFIEMP